MTNFNVYNIWNRNPRNPALEKRDWFLIIIFIAIQRTLEDDGSTTQSSSNNVTVLKF